MKFAVLHQELEWAEQIFQHYLERNGHEVILVDLCQTENFEFSQFDFVLNRVYASVANRNWQDNVRVLDLLGRLEAEGVKCINSQASTRADYDKFLSAQIMTEYGIPTPPTVLVQSIRDYLLQTETISAWGYPLIIKRNMGGRAKDICKVNCEMELRSWLERVFSRKYLDDYAAGMIIQPYLRSIRPYDIRIAIVADSVAYSYTRSLVSPVSGQEPWLGSGEWGSVLTEYHPTNTAIEMAKRATKSIGALINEVDLLETEDGFLVIENNPTPGFTEDKEVYLNSLCHSLLESLTKE